MYLYLIRLAFLSLLPLVFKCLYYFFLTSSCKRGHKSDQSPLQRAMTTTAITNRLLKRSDAQLFHTQNRPHPAALRPSVSWDPPLKSPAASYRLRHRSWHCIGGCPPPTPKGLSAHRTTSKLQAWGCFLAVSGSERRGQIPAIKKKYIIKCRKRSQGTWGESPAWNFPKETSQTLHFGVLSRAGCVPVFAVLQGQRLPHPRGPYQCAV